MKKRRLIISAVVALLVVLVGFFGYNTQVQAVNSKKYVQESIPTFFFHGYGSSYRAEEQMTNAAKKAGASDKIVRANVSPNGYVKLIGSIPKNAKNPIIEVNYDDNKQTDYYKAGEWAKNVVKEVQKDYKFKKMNMVGHSMGNMAINYYILENAKDNKLPKVNKVVDIAGHFNGIIDVDDEPNRMKLEKDGKPTKTNQSYKQLMGLRKVYPTSTKVLNIFGDKGDGTHSDEAVTNNSSKSLRYLVSDRAKSYQEKKIVGKQAQHSKLHENKQVDKILINFLWKK